MIDLKGRWVFITGASRGIGKLVAEFMAAQGANLILHSRKKEHCDGVLAMAKEAGVEAYAVEANLDSVAEVAKMLQEIDALNVDVDVVMNNAGLQVAYRTEYLKTPVSDYETSFYVNTISPMMICYHFIPKMVERGFGRLVNTTSGIRHDPYQAGYSASKAALNKVTVDVGTTLEGTGVCINLTDPGWCRTDLGGQHAPNAPESALPGVVVGALIENPVSNRNFAAGYFHGMSLEEAVEYAEKMEVLDL